MSLATVGAEHRKPHWASTLYLRRVQPQGYREASETTCAWVFSWKCCGDEKLQDAHCQNLYGPSQRIFPKLITLITQ